MSLLKIGAIMEKEVLTAFKEDSVLSLVERLQRHHIGAIVIIDKENIPIGIITERDIIHALVAYKENTLKQQAQDIMSSPVLTLDPSEDADSAITQMQFHRIRRIPVALNNKLVGIVTYRDLTNALWKTFNIMEEKNKALEIEANTDPLTGLFNRRYINKALKYHFGLAARSGHPMSVIMIDIDLFKKVNDTYGHQCGDYVLKTLADIFRVRSRDVNIVGRFGGEEFIIIGPIAEYKSATYLAERLRAIVDDTVFRFEDKIFKVTVSLGVCVWNSKIKDTKTMIKMADEALYAAKASGRNLVKVAEN